MCWVASYPGQPYGVAWPIACRTDLDRRQAEVIAEKLRTGEMVLSPMPEVEKP